jgi:hypothetical protein
VPFKLDEGGLVRVQPVIVLELECFLDCSEDGPRALVVEEALFASVLRLLAVDVDDLIATGFSQVSELILSQLVFQEQRDLSAMSDERFL